MPVLRVTRTHADFTGLATLLYKEGYPDTATLKMIQLYYVYIKTDDTHSESLHLGGAMVRTVRDVPAQISRPSVRSQPFYSASLVRNSCRNDGEGGHALLRMTGSELQTY